MRRLLSVVALLLAITAPAATQSNGKLQIHFMDVGQGDGAVLISPQGEVVLFDNGVLNQCGVPLAYLQSLGISKIDYHVASHYHSDHIGCTGTMLGMFPLQKFAFDRGGSYATQTYTSYVNAVGAKRVMAQKGQVLTLDASSSAPVTITFAALNGNGAATTDENDLSLVSVVRFGAFDAVIGGDLSGSGSGTIDPDPGTPCSYSVSPTSYSPGSGGGSTTVSVTTAANCAWSTSTNAAWLSISGGRVGSGTATLMAASNGSTARSGSVTVAGKAVSVNQAGSVVTPPPPPSDACPASPTPPSGAKARCNNGQWSSSQNRSGTCSSNGGVACWVCPGILCSSNFSYEGVQASEVPTHVSAETYADIESSVAQLVGKVEVYKVHHHGSRYSSNSAWMSTTTPKASVLSVGASNSYGHPTIEALSRLRNANTRTYWTSMGNGASPAAGWDFIGNNIVVEVAAGATRFTVRYGGTTDTYSTWGSADPLPPAPPFGVFDTPSNGQVVAGEVAVTGWALDNSSVAGVTIYRSPMAGEPTQPNGLVYIGPATFVPGARPDIAGAYPTYPQNQAAGWGYMLLSNFLPNGGNGTFTLHAIATDDAGIAVPLGQKTIIANNGSSLLPFGTIDTPTQGETVSGVIRNWGWALTPSPGMIPFDGSTIGVYIDNVFVGRPFYGLNRADIAAVFPGYANTNAAVGYVDFDTRTLANGVHTISWVVYDNRGGGQGIGSRYFTINNHSCPN